MGERILGRGNLRGFYEASGVLFLPSKVLERLYVKKTVARIFARQFFLILPLQILPGYVADPDLSLFQRMCNMQSAGKLQQIQKS